MVVAKSAPNLIVAAITKQPVVVGPAIDDIIAVTGIDAVISRAAFDVIAVAETPDVIVPLEPIDHVNTIGTDEVEIVP
jgi:hypothetical protein